MFLLIALLFSIPCPAQDRADFLIVRNIGAFSVLSRYEQPLLPEELRALPEGAPFRILELNTTLGDQVTPASRISCLNETCFLMKSDSLRFIGAQEKKDYLLLKGCTAFMDTLENGGGATARLFRDYPEKGGSFDVKKGERLIRAFQYRNHYYLVRLSRPLRAGWIALSKARGLSRPERTAAPDTTLPDELRKKIISRLASANRAYEQYFGYFNRLTGEQKSAPQWRPSEEGGSLRFTFSGKETLFEESTQALVRDLEGLLLGRPFEVVASRGAIAVLPKPGGR